MSGISAQRVDGDQPLVLENARARVEVLPAVGAMIHRFIDLRSGQDLLFHHPRVAPRPAPYRAPVDDWWCGGVIDGFPTGFQCVVGGETLPDFGEVWSEAWEVEQCSPTEATLGCSTRISTFRLTRSMSLVPDTASLRLSYRVENVGNSAASFIWGIHPTVPVGPDTVLQMSASVEHRVDLSAGAGAIGEGVPAPFGERPVRFDEVADTDQRLSYCTDMTEKGWFAAWDRSSRTGLSLSFDSRAFPCMWLWVLNGWRGLRALTVEPWTAWPGALSDAMKLGRARTLEAGAVHQASLVLSALDPIGDRITSIEDGVPTWN